MLSLQNFGTLVANMSARVQGSCNQLLDFTAGSVVRSIQEGSASQALWLQSQILQVLAAARLSTSTSSDVDTWFADYGLSREPAVPATGKLTVYRYVASTSATLLVGTTALTGDGTQTFVVGTDPLVPGYDHLLGHGVGGYLIPQGTQSLAGIPITAAVPGSGGNVSAGSISLVGGVAGIDYASNPAATTGGADAETDAAMKARFPLFIASLSNATLSAIESAIVSVQQGLTYRITANYDEAGNWYPGHFVIVIDDGSGSPSDALKSAVYTAVDRVRAFCETFSVQSPTIVYANIVLTLTVNAGSSRAALAPGLQTAIATFVNALQVGQVLPISRIATFGYAASPYVANVSAITINGISADLMPTRNQVVKIQSVQVN